MEVAFSIIEITSIARLVWRMPRKGMPSESWLCEGMVRALVAVSRGFSCGFVYSHT
jgi:hypothetical protein